MKKKNIRFDEGQLDGVNGPLHLLLPVEEHKDDHIYKMLTMHPCSNKMREVLGNPSLTPEEFLPIPGIKKSRVDLLFFVCKNLDFAQVSSMDGMDFPFFHQYQRSIDLNIVNIHPTEVKQAQRAAS